MITDLTHTTTHELYRLRPLIDHLNMNYMKLYNVSKQVNNNETMGLSKGSSTGSKTIL